MILKNKRVPVKVCGVTSQLAGIQIDAVELSARDFAKLRKMGDVQRQMWIERLSMRFTDGGA